MVSFCSDYEENKLGGISEVDGNCRGGICITESRRKKGGLTMTDTQGFEECDSERVFAEVGKHVDKAETRTLWGRLQEEMKRKGVGAAITYIEGEFTRIRESLTREIDRLE